MKIEKCVLNDALLVLGKVVCQTSPVELYRSIRFVGDVDGVMAMATDGVEVVSVDVEAVPEADVDFCIPFKHKNWQMNDANCGSREPWFSFFFLPQQQKFPLRSSG